MNTFGVPSLKMLKRYDAPGLSGKQIRKMRPRQYLCTAEKDALRNVIRKCEICGWNKHLEALIIHHCDRNPTNNRKGNLRVLCRNCHYLLHQKLLGEK